jgi:hypothetical protein
MMGGLFMSFEIPQNVDVIIGHPFGDVRISHEEWIETGPGPRIGVAPIKVVARGTNEELPIGIIPLPYRNDRESVEAIIRGEVADPGQRNKETLKELMDLYRK